MANAAGLDPAGGHPVEVQVLSHPPNLKGVSMILKDMTKVCDRCGVDVRKDDTFEYDDFCHIRYLSSGDSAFSYDEGIVAADLCGDCLKKIFSDVSYREYDKFNVPYHMFSNPNMHISSATIGEAGRGNTWYTSSEIEESWEKYVKEFESQ